MVFSQTCPCANRVRIKVIKLNIILLISLIWFFSPGVTAEKPSVESSIKVDNQEQTNDDIEMAGMHNILNLQHQVYQAEERFFELFNELNDDDLYDIHCRMHAPIGTKIKKRACVPNFYEQLTADKAQSFLNRAIHGLEENKRVEVQGAVTASAAIPHHYTILKKKMKDLVKTNPELYNRITKLHNLTEKLEKERRIYSEKNDDKIE